MDATERRDMLKNVQQADFVVVEISCNRVVICN